MSDEWLWKVEESERATYEEFLICEQCGLVVHRSEIIFDPREIQPCCPHHGGTVGEDLVELSTMLRRWKREALQRKAPHTVFDKDMNIDYRHYQWWAPDEEQGYYG